jgi:Lar family restriction alleviation protein
MGKIKKKCPYCAESFLTVRSTESGGYGWMSHTKFFVRCEKCGAYGPTKGTEEEAIKAWNERRRVPKKEEP